MRYLTQIQGHTLWRPGLYPGATAVDLGANRAAFSRGLIEKYGCRSIALEANPKLASEIENERYLAVFNYAVSASEGVLRFHLAENDEESSIYGSRNSTSVPSIEVESIHLERFLASRSIQKIDVLKLDIEGAEIEVLASCSDDFLRNVGQVTVEFHDFLGLTPLEDIHRTIARFESLGFACIKIWQHAWGDVLLINRFWHKYSLPQILWSKYWTRNVWGLQRVLARSLALKQPRQYAR